MNHAHAPFELQWSRQRKVPSNDTHCQRLTTTVTRQRVPETAKNLSSLRVNSWLLTMTQNDSEGETNCPFRKLGIHEKPGAFFNRIRQVTGDLAKRLRNWLRSTRCGMHQSAAVQSIENQSPTSHCDCRIQSDRQMGNRPSSLDSLINAWPGLKPHVREAIQTLVDAAKLVESGSISDNEVKCHILNCSGCNHEGSC